MTMISPAFEEFRKLASRGNLIPVVAEIVSDVETPVGAFQKIGRDGFSFLFESAERNEESGRFSLIGIDPLLIVSQRGSEVTIRDKSGAVTNRSTSDPLGELQKVLGEFRFVPRDDICKRSSANSALFRATTFPIFKAVRSASPVMT